MMPKSAFQPSIFARAGPYCQDWRSVGGLQRESSAFHWPKVQVFQSIRNGLKGGAMGAGSVRYAEGFGRIDGRCPAAASDQEDSHQNQYDDDGNDAVLRQRGKTLIGFQMSPVLLLPEIIIL